MATRDGGGGLSADEDKVLMQEMSRIRARSPLQSFGIWMLGPALLEFASEEQKLHYLPQIARGEIRGAKVIQSRFWFRPGRPSNQS